MLVLSRQRDESIIIGDDIKITIIDIRGDKVRLGVEAPVDVPVHRQEVYEAIRRENKEFEPGEKPKPGASPKPSESSPPYPTPEIIGRSRIIPPQKKETPLC